jgi:hypothetical protein
MASLQQLYAFEDAVEKAFLEILNVDPVVPVFLDFSDQEKVTPYIEIRLSDMRAKGSRILPNGAEVAHIWEGMLISRVVTSRGQNSDQHAGIVGWIRTAVIQAQTKINLPYHKIARVLPTDSPRGIQPELRLDWTEVHHLIVIGIDNNAWPTPS